MTLQKGRSSRPLPDLGIYPAADSCYEPRPAGDVEKIPLEILLDKGHKLQISRYFRRGTSIIVRFGINQSYSPTGDGWRDIARIDTAHGTVHRHQFTHLELNQTTSLEEITAQHGEEIINRWYEQARRIMLEEWRENLRRWGA